MIEDWSVNVLSTKFDFAYGETTSIGIRGPYPQRPSMPPSGVPFPHFPRPLSWSLFCLFWVLVPEVCVHAEELTIGLIWWSYQPSESSHVITIAVLLQKSEFWSALMTVTTNSCSISGSE